MKTETHRERNGKPAKLVAVQPPAVEQAARVADTSAVWLPVAELHRWEGNPRKNDPAVPRVAASIRRFGFVAPIVVWKAADRMVAGDTRLKALRSLMAESPDFVPKGAPGPGLARVIFHDFANEDEANLYAIADNRLNELAEWDEEARDEILAHYDDESRALAGYDDDVVLADGEDAVEAPIPEPPPIPITKRGDVWMLGHHRLLCGDCREPADVAKLLAGERINVAFTSPPYASQRKYDESSGFKPIPPDEYVAWFDAVQANVRAHLADDGSWFVNIKEHCDAGQRSLYVMDLALSHARPWGWRFVDELIWHKAGMPGLFGDRFKNEFEPVFHFANGKCKTRFDNVTHDSETVPSGSVGSNASMQGKGDPLRDRKAGRALPGNVLWAPPDTACVGDHGARFPVALPAFFINAFSDADDVIFDPFMGSGTTIIACEKSKRRGFGIEISPGYCDVIVARWEALTGGKGVRADAK